MLNQPQLVLIYCTIAVWFLGESNRNSDVYTKHEIQRHTAIKLAINTPARKYSHVLINEKKTHMYMEEERKKKWKKNSH